MRDLLLVGGLVLSSEGTTQADLLISDGRISSMAEELAADDADLLDCHGAWVGPGFVDLHTHLREPGEEWKEDVESGSEAAAAGGYTAVVAMPNTTPPTDAGHLARYLIERGRGVGLVSVVPAGAVSMGLRGEKLSHLDELLGAGVQIFSDDGRTVSDAGLLRRVMEYLAPHAAVIAQHAEDEGLSAGGAMHEGSVSSRLGIVGIPKLAEEVVVARDIALVRLTGARYHVQHVSCAGTVELVRNAKSEGLPVTAEVTPHHLALDHSVLQTTSAAYKMYPPLRTAEDVQAVSEGLADGTIDAIATDHAPHAPHEKEVPFEEAPRGVIGLETAAGIAFEASGLGPEDFFDRMSVAPARIAGLEDQGLWVAEGHPAHLAVFDPEATWTPTEFVSRSQNSPFAGRTITGGVRYTVFGGRVTWRDGKIER